MNKFKYKNIIIWDHSFYNGSKLKLLLRLMLPYFSLILVDAEALYSWAVFLIYLFCENVSKKLLDYILQVFFQIHVVGLSLQFEQFLFCLDKHKWAKAWSQRTCLAHSVVIVFRYVENLNVNGEYHQKSLSKSYSKTKQTEKYQAIENLDVIDSTSVHWRTGQPRFQSIIFCSSWPKFSSQIGTLNGNYLWKILPLQKLELKFPQFSFHLWHLLHSLRHLSLLIPQPW